MTIPLLSTKLHIPRPRPELVIRPRLIERLNAGLDCQLTLVSTPAGFGKTTLLGSWAAHCGAAVAWLSLDEGDNDPVRFLAHLFAGLQSVDGCLGADLLVALQSPQPPLLQELLIGLINQLSAFPAPCVVVLDDYHLIEAAAVHSLLAFLLEHQPTPLHLVLASRADPPLPLARLRATGQLVELRLKDLRFTPAEAAEFLGRAVGPALSGEGAQLLTSRTEGWIAGLQMAAASMRDRDAEHIGRFIGSFTGQSHFVLDYLAEEVLGRQPPEIQSFLLRTSILERLSGPLCDAVLSPSAAALGAAAPTGQDILDRLEHANLFLVPLDDEQRWYRYHRLFADLLRHRLQQAEPALVPVLCQRASEWHAQNGLLAEAISYALAAGDHKRALSLVEQVAEATLMHSEVATFLGWTARLPSELVRSRPVLRIYQAWAQLINGESLETVEALLSSANSAPGREAGLAAPLRAFIALFRGEVLQATSLARQAMEALPESEAFLRGLAALTLGLAHFTDGDEASGRQALDVAAQISQETGNLMVAVTVLCSLAEQCRKQGQLHQAYSLYEQALERATMEQGRRWPVAGRALIGLGDILREWNDLEAAERHLADGIDLANQWGQVWALTGYIALARLWQAQGKAAEARQAMAKALQKVHHRDFSRISRLAVEMSEAWLALNQGDLPLARRWAERRGQGVDPAELDQSHDFEKYHMRKYEYPVLARLWIAEGRPAQALALLDQALPKVEAQKRPALVIDFHLLRAQALSALKQTGQALPILEQALTQAEPENYVRLLVDEGEPLRRLLTDFRPWAEKHNARLTSYVEKLLAAFGQPPSPQPPLSRPRQAPSPLAAEALSEREMEVLRLLATSLSAAEIADELTVAVSTVRSHTKNIYGKLGVSGRLEALQRARELNLL